MELLFVFFALLVNLIPILLIVGVIWLIARANNRAGEKRQQISSTSQVADRDAQWLQYIKALRDEVSSKPQKDILNRILHESGYVEPIIEPIEEKPAVKDLPTESDSPQVISINPMPSPEATLVNSSVSVNTPSTSLDGTLLLLYFGAFLFVASSGLFVAFGGFNGTARTLIITLVMAVMYGGGLTLYGSKRLRQAGIAFTAIGMAIAPLVGVAIYSYMTNQTQGTAIWLGTSVLCLIMYLYALYVIRSTLIGYLVIFSALSLFQSGIAIVNVPTYYFVWGLLAAGLLLKLFSLIKHTWPELQQPSQSTAIALVPITLIASLFFAPSQGIGQLAISFGLASLYYLLEAWTARDTTRQLYAATSHAGSIATVLFGTYALTSSLPAVSIACIVLGVAHIITIIAAPKDDVISQNIATIALVLPFLVPVFNPSSGLTWLIAVILALGLGATTALRQRREDAFDYTLITLVALPFIVSQLVIDASLTQQALFSSGVTLVIFAVVRFVQHKKKFQDWYNSAATLFVLGAVVSIIAAFITNEWLALATTVLVATLFVINGVADKDKDWTISSGIIISLPIVYGFVIAEQAFFPTAILLALGWNIFLALRFRQESSRWLSTFLWLLLPLGVGLGGYGFTLDATGYAWAYMLAAMGLILSRLIARGVVFTSSKVPLLSYSRTKSVSYVVGYTTSLFLSIMISLGSTDSQLHTSLLLMLTFLLTFLLAKYIEKQASLYAALPVIAQAFVFSVLRVNTGSDDGSVKTLYLISLVLNIAMYYLAMYVKDKNVRSGLLQSTLLVAFTSPLIIAAFGTFTSWPFFLFYVGAGCLLIHYVWQKSQAWRESAIMFTFLSSLGILYTQGVEPIHVYTHLLALVFAAFAVWRTALNDVVSSKAYVYTAFFTVTVPLVLQAIGGANGDFYGWLLIIEQVLFMLIGVSTNRRYLTQLGLYTALLAVLYQLRDLGWAALSLLALFIIGVAVRRLMKFGDK